MVLPKGLHIINLSLKLAQYLHPLSSFWHCNWHFPFFLTTCLTFRATKVRVTFSLESLIRLIHGSSFRNSLGVWDVRVGHYRLRAFSQVAKNLRGRMERLVPVPKTSCFAPEVNTVFLPSTKTLYSGPFSSSSFSVKVTGGILYTFWLFWLLLDDSLLPTILWKKCSFPCFLLKKTQIINSLPFFLPIFSHKNLSFSCYPSSPWKAILKRILVATGVVLTTVCYYIKSPLFLVHFLHLTFLCLPSNCILLVLPTNSRPNSP